MLITHQWQVAAIKDSTNDKHFHPHRVLLDSADLNIALILSLDPFSNKMLIWKRDNISIVNSNDESLCWVFLCTRHCSKCFYMHNLTLCGFCYYFYFIFEEILSLSFLIYKIGITTETHKALIRIKWDYAYKVLNLSLGTK